MGTKGPDNSAGNPDVSSGAQADTPMLQKPAIGDMVQFKWGEETVSGKIIELEEGGQFKVVGGDSAAYLVADTSKLTHHEFTGDVVTWSVTVETNADFTATKAYTVGDAINAFKKLSKGGTLKKGMYSVGEFAGLLSGISWLARDIEWEGVSENDDPKDADMAKKLGKLLAEAAALMVEYTKDEINELVASHMKDGDDLLDVVIELSAQPGGLMKAASSQKTVGEVLKKAFDAKAVTGTTVADIEKAVSNKVAEEVQKAVSAQLSKIASLEQEIAVLKEVPAAPKGVLKAVSKDSSNLASADDSEVAPVVKNGKVDDVATALKKSFAQPQNFNRLSTQ
jgi:hypothetical protein